MNTTKDEYIKYLKDEKKITDEVIAKAFSDMEQEVKSAGITDTVQIANLTLKKVSLYFRKISKGTESTPVLVIPIGASNVTDYGARVTYNESLKIFEQNPDQAINNGYCNNQGEPLWRTSKLKGKNGRKIVPDRELQRTLYCLAKRDEDTIWKIGQMTLRGDILTKGLPEIGKLYNTKGIIAKSTAETHHNERIVMYSAKDTVFGNFKDTPEPFLEMVVKYATKLVIPFKEILNHARSDNSFIFIVKADVVNTKETLNPDSSNLITIVDPDELIDIDKELNGWIAQDIPLNVIDGALSVAVVAKARTYLKKIPDSVEEEEALQFEVLGVIANTNDIKTVENTPVISSGVTEEVVNDTPAPTTTEKIPGW